MFVFLKKILKSYILRNYVLLNTGLKCCSGFSPQINLNSTFCFYFFFVLGESVLLLVLSFVSGSLSSSLLPPLSLSRNPIDPNGLISGVRAITHMRTERNLSHFWRKLISRNKEPSVFPPQWSELILPLELAQTPPSPIFCLLQPICSFNYTVVW